LPSPVHLRPRENVAPEGLVEPLRLSPHHNVLVASHHVARHFGHTEAMAEIGALSRRSTPRFEMGAPALSYHHIITEHHDLIMTCGIWAETTGRDTASMLDVSPELRRASKVFDGVSTSPRTCLSKEEAGFLRNLLSPEETLLHLLAA
jgi:hypothetical protein